MRFSFTIGHGAAGRRTDEDAAPAFTIPHPAAPEIAAPTEADRGDQGSVARGVFTPG